MSVFLQTKLQLCSFILFHFQSLLFYILYFILYLRLKSVDSKSHSKTHESLCSLSNFPIAVVLTYAQHPELIFQMKMDLFIYCTDYNNLQHT